MSRIRINVLYGFFVLAFGAVIFRAVQLQIMPQTKIETLMDRQLKRKFEIHGRRGLIVDRNGRELALSANSISLFVDPSKVIDAKSLSKSLAALFNADQKSIFNKISKKNKRFVWISRQLDLDTYAKFEKAKLSSIPGIGVIPEFRRFYPNGKLASQVLGFVSVDGDGLSGVEKSFDNVLKGPRNTLHISRDAWGRPLFGQQEQTQLELMMGERVELTIDTQLQFATEKALLEAIKKHEAVGGVAIVMDPYTGEVLSLANYPFFNANIYDQTNFSARRNNAITNPIEPGSVVKAFVVAKALDMGLVTPNTKISGGDGTIKIGNKIIGEADDKHKFKSMSMTDLIRYSSNVGVVNLQRKMGFDSVFNVFRDVGFGQMTGIELAGESPGIFRKPRPQQLLEQATISFGQGIAATPLQLASAFSVLANGGYYVSPTIIKSPKLSKKNPPKRVLSEQTAQKMRAILERVVEEEGTGTLAKVEGFRSAGKTGTSQKVDYQKGGYKKSAYWSSFAGFIPADKPQFVIYVMVDEPKANGYYGGQVAAPVFSNIARSALRQSFQELKLAKSEEKLIENNDWQTRDVPNKTQASHVATKNSRLKMPDLRGLSVRRALQRSHELKLSRVEILTQGRIVEDQVPRAGEIVEKNEKIYLKLR